MRNKQPPQFQRDLTPEEREKYQRPGNHMDVFFIRGAPPIGSRFQWIVRPYRDDYEPWFRLERVIGRYIIWRREDTGQLYESTHDGPLDEIEI